MTKKWYNDQPRGGEKPYRFAPKWSPETIQWIIDQLSEMTDVAEIQIKLIRDYDIGARSADKWIEIARRVMVDIQNGLTIDQALERDRERRNMLRRKNKSVSVKS